MLDIIILVPLLWAAYKGFKKGFIIMACTLIALGLGIFLGIRFSDQLSAWAINESNLSTEFLPILSFSAIFIVVVIGVNFLGKGLEKVVNMAAMKLVNKLAGLLFSVLRMALILSVILMIINAFDAQVAIVPKKLKESSLLYVPISGLAAKVVPAVKNSEWVAPLFDQAQEAI